VGQAFSLAIPREPHDFINLQASIFLPTKVELGQMYKTGLSLREVALRAGLSKTTVRDQLLEFGASLRSRVQSFRTPLQAIRGKLPAKPPFGFWYCEGAVVRHPKEYPMLLVIIRKWKLGQSINSIADELQGKQIPSPMGKKWSWNSVNNIIQRVKSQRLKQIGNDYELIWLD